MSTIIIDSASSRGPSEERLARLVTVALAGLFGAAAMYWVWRVGIGIPLELSVPVHMSDQGSPVRPWAPWWVPTSILAAIAMPLWRLLAARRDRILAWRGALVFVLILLLAHPTAFLCLELGATAQFYPRPSLQRVLTVLPLMVSGAIGNGAMVLMAGGAFMFLPLAALIGAANAGIGKLILRIGRRRAKATWRAAGIAVAALCISVAATSSSQSQEWERLGDGRVVIVVKGTNVALPSQGSELRDINLISQIPKS